MRGLIIYKGPSEFDGKPIVAVLVFSAGNGKTRSPALWVLPDIEVEDGKGYYSTAREAARSVCGGCPLFDVTDDKGRHGTACFAWAHALPIGGVFRSIDVGNYVPDFEMHKIKAWGELEQPRRLRNAYIGDPAAVPRHVLEPMLQFMGSRGQRRLATPTSGARRRTSGCRATAWPRLSPSTMHGWRRPMVGALVLLRYGDPAARGDVVSIASTRHVVRCLAASVTVVVAVASLLGLTASSTSSAASSVSSNGGQHRPQERPHDQALHPPTSCPPTNHAEPPKDGNQTVTARVRRTVRSHDGQPALLQRRRRGFH